MARTPKRAAVVRKQQAEAIAFSMRLPAELVTALAEIASEEGRSRAKQIEIMLREAVQNYRRGSAA